MIKNEEAFKKALETLTENDKKTLEAFARFLLISTSDDLTKNTVSVSTPVVSVYTNIVNKANNILLKDYVELKVDSINYSMEHSDDLIDFNFAGRDRAIAFPAVWFVHHGDYFLSSKIKKAFVKYRPGTNRIDKVAIDSDLLSDLGKKEGKKRILALSTATTVKTTITTPPTTSSDFVKKIISASSDDWMSTPDGWTNNSVIKASMPKNHPMFSSLVDFKADRLRLSRVGEVLFNHIDSISGSKYIWDSKTAYGHPHDFSNKISGITYDVKCHFDKRDRLQLSNKTLARCDADYIISILVEQDSTSYTATVVGYIKTIEFMNRTTPWAYNEHIDLRSMEIHELNSPKDLF